jgi:hypothetical protein
MRNDLRLCVDHFLDQFGFTLKIGNKNFQFGPGVNSFNFPDCFGPETGAQIGQIVAIDRCYNRMFQLHDTKQTVQPSLVRPDQEGAVSRSAPRKIAVPGADVPKDHKTWLFPVPEFPNIGAISARTNGLQMMLVNQVLHFRVTSRLWEAASSSNGAVGVFRYFRLTY